MSNDWIEVLGNRKLKPRKNQRNRNKYYTYTHLPDKSKICFNFEKIKVHVHNVYNNCKPFLSHLLNCLKNNIHSKNVYIYALGCGTIENSSLVLSKSCIFQWVVCRILLNFLNVRKVFIFDPQMTDNDYQVWDLLLNHNFELENPEFAHQYHDNNMVSCELTSTDCFDLNDEMSHVILWMPHCEKFLYSAVLDGILSNKSPLKVSKSLSKTYKKDLESKCPDKSFDFSQLSNDSSDNSSDSDDRLVDEDSSNFLESFCLENTTLVGNSLSDCSFEDFRYKAEFTSSETQLLPFETHHQSFNDTFVTIFTRIS
ncbi:uncharacterized protein TA06495 [Theileria annulata]|uniref:SRR1-like domain-containing protein n=1 Tax=Theileria annulata TaxID=5874 RepID=Q4UIC9_THEAN|nr:uncharacterized protein TA06495 [Theileria annulata]CAI73160.1 hypothetical protein, conserved [Theileria annulata]|eukprot:XP_953838.1 hypothetical protein, conserved [Theileria annulata]